MAVDVYKVSSTGIKTAETLVPGQYVIYLIPDNSGSKLPGYVYYDAIGKGGNPARHYLSNNQFDVSSGEVNDLNYIWTVTQDENGNFSVTLTNDNTKFWMYDTKWRNNMTGTAKAILMAENSNNADGINFKPTEEMYKGDGATPATDTYLNCNGALDTYYTSKAIGEENQVPLNSFSIQ